MNISMFIGSRVINAKGEEGIVKDADSKSLTISYGGNEPKKYAFCFVVDNKKIRFVNPEDQEEADRLAGEEKVRQEREKAIREEDTRLKVDVLKNQKPFNGRQTVGESRQNMIIKATYCDGGQTTGRIGFCGICSDTVAARILLDVVKLKKGKRDQKLAEEFLEEYCRRNKVDLSKIGAPDGALTIM